MLSNPSTCNSPLTSPPISTPADTPFPDALAGKVAAVTGAGAGLGQAIAISLAEAGADVAVLEINREAGLAVAAELEPLGVRAHAYEVDVARSDQVDETLNAVAADLGGLDVLVNNAGISRIGPTTDQLSDADWHDSIAVMQTGVFFGMRAAGRIMIAQGRGGAIINISSIRGFTANPGRIMYCAPKAAVLMMTKVAAGEWGRHGIRVNAIAPGFMRTPMWDLDVARGVLDTETTISHVPLGRMGDPIDVGNAVVFLASDASSYMSGTCLTVDGATTALPADADPL